MMINGKKNIKKLYSSLQDVVNKDLKEFKNLKKLYITSYESLSKNDIDKLIDNSNLDQIMCYSIDVNKELQNQSICLGYFFVDGIIYKKVAIVKNIKLGFNNEISVCSNNVLTKLNDILCYLKQHSFNVIRIDEGLILPTVFEIPLIKYDFSKNISLHELKSHTLTINKVHNINHIIKIVNVFEFNKYQIDLIVIKLNNQDYPNINKLKALDKKYNLEIRYGELNSYKLDDFIKMRKTINNYKKKILKLDLSPFEQITYAYDIIKSLPYVEESDDDIENVSRDICGVIKYGKIVCSGYSVFLAQLLKELGYKIYFFGLKKINHAQNIIEVIDEKYGVNGMYVFDCTWDSVGKIVKCIRSNGKEELCFATSIKDGDKVIKYGYSKLLSYRYFMISKSEYEKIFETTLDSSNVYAFNVNIDDEVSDVINMVNDSKVLSKDCFIKLIRNVKLKQGYNLNNVDKIVKDIIDFNQERFKCDIDDGL